MTSGGGGDGLVGEWVDGWVWVGGGSFNRGVGGHPILAIAVFEGEWLMLGSKTSGPRLHG